MAKYKIGMQNDFPGGQAKACKVADFDLAVYALSNGYYATQARCTHLKASLTDGEIIDDRLIQCHRHRARFDIRTGEVVDWANFPPGIQILNLVCRRKALKTFPVSVEDGTLYVEI
ncbi:Rieske (2Fe-2S) protein [Acidithiobacillus sp.]|uniref:Rieske (2Fe-2S) protein n=1 Tax=Acidithiobacillus sp. TaxID=1872118 RepID=UPI00263830E1|nr:Rieske (2Fe-2S) protein [Acidithiobacillus sp.]